DDMAAGVVRTATRLGISIPGELSVAGCDDITLAQQIFPSLTTIRQPLAAMAEAASRALIKGSRGADRNTGLETIPGTIQVRESTGPAPVHA
ncbi:MAG: substrate-binding domain-containing protein, partial [Gammaproteobacteria bacterium]|nr:substrate-binding domain-containing protein [Gammaproteobacteria bacterium]